MPEENDVYLALPYLNREGLETYTRLILRKMIGLVVSSTTNIADYEREYSANPLVSVTTIEQDIEPDTEWTLEAAYGVGTGQLRVTVSGYIMYPGLDYEEVGAEGETSYKIKFKTSIQAGSVLGIVVYPRQFSFGRNINVSTLAAPEASVSPSPDNLVTVDSEGRIFASRSELESAVAALASTEDCVHLDGSETLTGEKTFTRPIRIDASGTNLQDAEYAPLVTAAFKANGMPYSLVPMAVLAGRGTDEAYSGALMLGSSSGCTWLGSGDSFLRLPQTLSASGVDFANDESVIVTSDSKFTVYVGCANDGTSFVKALQINPSGEASFPVGVTVPTMPSSDSSGAAASTEYVRRTAVLAEGDSTVNGKMTFSVLPSVPTADLDSSGNEAASTAFVKRTAVLVEGDQRVEGIKTFLEDVQTVKAQPWTRLQTTQVKKGTETAVPVESGVAVADRDGDSLAALRYRINPSGEALAALTIANPAGTDDSCSIGVSYSQNGSPETFAPTPAAGDASEKIATTQFVADAVQALRRELRPMIESAIEEAVRRFVIGQFEDEEEDGNLGG